MRDSKCARAAYIEEWGGRTDVGDLVWREAVIIEEIAAHPPNLAEFFVFIAIKGFKVCSTWIDESIIILLFSTMIGMQCSTVRQSLKDTFHYL